MSEYGNEKPVHRNLCNSFDAEGMAGFEGFNENRLERGNFISPEDVIIAQIAFTGHAELVVAHFFADGIAKRLDHAAFNLAGSG